MQQVDMTSFALFFLGIVHCISAVRFRARSDLNTGVTHELQLRKPFANSLAGMIEEGPHYPEIRLQSLDVISKRSMVRRTSI